VQQFNPDKPRPLPRPSPKKAAFSSRVKAQSRIFPAKNAIRKAMTWGMDLSIATDGFARPPDTTCRNLPSSALQLWPH
jgi:hypothetical protein